MSDNKFFPFVSNEIEEIPSLCRGCTTDFDYTADREGFSAKCRGCPTLKEQLNALQFEQGSLSG